MLAFHLNPDIDAASRRRASIDGFADWLDARFGLATRRITDLGCGPGLYAERMAARGATVTGVDFSSTALAHARQSALRGGFVIDYREADYLEGALPEAQDIVTLIYADYCPLAPAMRSRLLGRVREMLVPGGSFVFDVFSPGQMSRLREGFEAGHRYGDGFWAPGDYYGFKRTFLWPDLLISLERYLISAEDRQFGIFNWMQYFAPESITAELTASGFEVETLLEVDTGEAWQGGATPITVIAHPR
jgi:SAM-dependent methyltransferase